MSGASRNCAEIAGDLCHGLKQNDDDGESRWQHQKQAAKHCQMYNRAFGPWFVFGKGFYAQPPVSGVLPRKSGLKNKVMDSNSYDLLRMSKPRLSRNIASTIVYDADLDTIAQCSEIA